MQCPQCAFARQCRNIHRVITRQQAGAATSGTSFVCDGIASRGTVRKTPTLLPARLLAAAVPWNDPSFPRCAFQVSSAPYAPFVVCTAPTVSRAQDSTASDRPWYDRLSIRGYAQFRYNRLLETNEQLQCPTCDRSIGDNGGSFCAARGSRSARR